MMVTGTFALAHLQSRRETADTVALLMDRYGCETVDTVALLMDRYGCEAVDTGTSHGPVRL